MTVLRSIATLALIMACALPAGAADVPYAKLAEALGVPTLVDSAGTANKSQLHLVFVRAGESKSAWTKRLTVDIAKSDPGDTRRSTRDAIARFRHELNARHVRVDRFELSSGDPQTAYYEIHLGKERDRGIAYSPRAGFITFAQLAQLERTTITGDDVAFLRHVVGR